MVSFAWSTRARVSIALLPKDKDLYEEPSELQIAETVETTILKSLKLADNELWNMFTGFAPVTNANALLLTRQNQKLPGASCQYIRPMALIVANNDAALPTAFKRYHDAPQVPPPTQGEDEPTAERRAIRQCRLDLGAAEMQQHDGFQNAGNEEEATFPAESVGRRGSGSSGSTRSPQPPREGDTPPPVPTKRANERVSKSNK